MSLAELLASAEPLQDGFRLAIPESWHQGRTAYGGLTAVLALHAARLAGGEDLPPLRSAQVSFVGPVYGEVEARARVLRRGRNAVWITAELLRANEQGGEVGTVATFVFMSPVENQLQLKYGRDIPGLIPLEQSAVREIPPGGPRLLDHMEIRFALPRGGDPKPEICYWLRAREREGIDPVLQLLLCADAPPPGVFAVLPRPVPPISSMTWLFNLLTPVVETRDGWWLMRVTGETSGEGCSSDRTEIWNADGEAVALGMQSVAIFG
jgi:acyl-CoA thioesterase